MSNIIKTPQGPSAKTIEQVLIGGDLSKLTSEEKLSYYNNVCASLGLNPLTRPFDFIRPQGKEILYAKRDATDQLRKLHNISIKIVSRAKVDDVFFVTAQATATDGRTDESIGAVSIVGIKGTDLANALMKAETKAKRRVALSICGLGMLDETEAETIDTVDDEEKRHAERNKQMVGTLKKQIKDIQKQDIAKNLPLLVDPGERPIMQGKARVGKKFGNKKYNEVSMSELMNYRTYLLSKSEEDNAPLSREAEMFIEELKEYQAFKQNELNQRTPIPSDRNEYNPSDLDQLDIEHDEFNPPF